MTYIAPVLGLLAGVAGIADTIPYVRDTVGGTTRPHRGTWLIWSVLAIVVCLSQRAGGASWSLIMAAAQAVLTSAVFLLSIRRGEGGLSLAEVLMIALAGGGVIGWIVAGEPVIATACVVAADLIGAAMMVPKTYRDPCSETLATFALASLSGALAAGAVGALTLSLLLYPVYFCLVNGAIAVLIHHRRSLLADRVPCNTGPAGRFIMAAEHQSAPGRTNPVKPSGRTRQAPPAPAAGHARLRNRHRTGTSRHPAAPSTVRHQLSAPSTCRTRRSAGWTGYSLARWCPRPPVLVSRCAWSTTIGNRIGPKRGCGMGPVVRAFGRRWPGGPWTRP